MKKLIRLKIFQLALIWPVAIGCGLNGNQRLTTNDSRQDIVQSGSSYTYVVLRLEFLEQVRQLCEDKNAPLPYPSEEERRAAVANCTFESLALLNVDFSQIEDFSNQYCSPGADLSGFTPAQVADILAACAVLG